VLSPLSPSFATFLLILMAKTSKIVPHKEKASSSRPCDDKAPTEPSVQDYIPGPCILKTDFRVENPSSVPGRCEHVSMYTCSIAEVHLEAVRKDCGWGSEVVLQIPSSDESVTTYVEGFLSVYTYPFTLGAVDPVIFDFCRRYQVTLGQIHPSLWRIVILLRFFSIKAGGLDFSLNHLIRLYRPQIYRGLIRLYRRASKALMSSIDEDKDRGWMGRYIRVRTRDLIPEEKMSFPEKWNFDRK